MQGEELEAGLATWQPMVVSGINGNRELILQLNSRCTASHRIQFPAVACCRIEVLENALAQLSPPSRREEETRAAQVGGAGDSNCS